jgi:hypothetical protein
VASVASLAHVTAGDHRRRRQKARLAGGPRGRNEGYRFFFGFFCSFFIAVPLDIAASMTTLHTGQGVSDDNREGARLARKDAAGLRCLAGLEKNFEMQRLTSRLSPW